MAALEPTEQNLAALSGVLKATTQGENPAAVKAATEQLTALESRAGYSLCLLQLLSLPAVDATVKHTASITFKNLILRCWAYEGSERQEKGEADLLSAHDRGTIKQHILTLMVSQPKAIQKQLGQALAIISSSDFPQNWSSLLPELLARFDNAQVDANALAGSKELIGVLEVMHSIFYRYRVELKSNKLWEEIKIVVEQAAEPLSKLFLRWVARLGDAKLTSNAAVLGVLVETLSLIVDIFYSLNSQEIVAQFEEVAVLQLWFNNGLELLKYTSPLLDTKDDEEPTKLDTLKATICDVINLFCYKYEDQFAPFVPGYVSTIWTLITTLSGAKRFDQLVNSAIKFLTAVVKKSQFSSLFNNEDALKAFCEKVIIPQLKLRDTDIEVFESNPQEYIRIDIEGSDVDTRRRTVVDFIHGLTQNFEVQISTILKGYVQMLIAQYEAARAAKGKDGYLAKDAAMYIILALSAKKSSVAKGITETNPYVDIGSFFTTQVIPELSAAPGAVHPIILAACLKYLAVFRQQLPLTFYQQLMPILLRFLPSDNVVLHTYASYAIERMLSVKEGADLRFNKEALRPFLQPTLEGLFGVLSHEESKENEYVMKAIMRVCQVGQDAMTPFASVIIQKITGILSYVSVNPKNPRFNHSMMETIGALIKYLCKPGSAGMIESFEAALMPPFLQMLNMDSAAEFSPYVFQLLAQLLELRTELTAQYISLFPALLSPGVWSNAGNGPALVRLLQAYLAKPGVWQALFAGTPRFSGLVGIFQLLLGLRSTQVQAMDLFTSMAVDLDLSVMGKDLLAVFSGILLAKLMPTGKPTPRLLKSAAHLFLAMIAKHGFDTTKAFIDQIQAGLFNQLFKLVLANVHFMHSDTERKLGAVVLINLTTRTPSFLADPAYLALWGATLTAAVKLINPRASREIATVAGAVAPGPDGSSVEEEDADDILNQSEKSFSTAYSKLSFSSVAERDLVAAVAQTPKDYAKASLEALFAQHPGKFGSMLSALPAADAPLVSAFFSANTIALR